MVSVNIFDAKTNLSKYISAVESGKESFIVVMRSGKPVAKIVPYENEKKRIIGIAKGEIPELDDIDAFNSVDLEEDFLGTGGLL